MAIIPQVKCSRCDRKYSGLRTRCPFCGARRYSRSTRAAQEDNSMWKVVVGVLLLVVLIAAVVVLIVTSLNETPSQPVDNNTPVNENPTSVVNDPIDPNTNTDDPNNSVEDPNTEDPNTNTEDPVENTEDPNANTEVPKPMVNDIMITYNNRRAGVYNSTDQIYEITMKAGESLNLGAAVTPQGIEAELVWESTDEGVVAVLQTGRVTAVGKGTCRVRVSADGVADELMIRVRG